MTTTTGTDPGVALARSAVYAALAQGLAYPTPQRQALLAERLLPVLGDLQPDDAAVSQAVGDCLSAFPDHDPASLVQAHQQQFTIIESRDCPTYETAFRGRDVFRQAHVMADVAGCYAAHGLAIGAGERERPDHITVELEFMSFLTAQQAYALDTLGPDEVETATHTQRLFLREHLGTWGPGFGRRVEATASHPFYRQLGALLAVWLDADMHHLGVEPTETADEPVPPPPPDDGACGPASPDAWPIQLQRRPS
jgi:DMSO reductase family type II enzyme chaperone